MCWAVSESASFAGERHQVLATTHIALDAQEAMFEEAAIQVVVELAANTERNAILRGINRAEKLFWGLFARRREYQTLTLRDLAEMPSR